jgi:pimeloyl-ACP methyl ester carboxylesterase
VTTTALDSLDRPSRFSPRYRALAAIVLLHDVPFWSKSLSRRVARFFAFGGYSYVGILLVLLALENRLLFPGSTFATEWYEPATELAVQNVELSSADGNTIHAWWSVPVGWKPERGAILYSHGNGGNLSMRQGNIAQWRRTTGKAVLIYDYPGYGKSTGKPTEAGCYAAVNAAYDWLVEEQKVSPSELLLVGSSLGGAMAVDLAVRRECRALVLINPFTSFPDMAQKTFPWFPARWLVSNRLDNLSKIGKCRVPVFITHGTSDTLIPFSQGERLFAAAKEPKRFLPRPGDGHWHPTENAFFEAVLAFLYETRTK